MNNIFRCSVYLFVSHMFFTAAMGPMLELVVEVAVAVLTKVMVSPLARATISRVMEATTRVLTAALAPTTREDMAAMVHPSQVEADSVAKNFQGPISM